MATQTLPGRRAAIDARTLRRDRWWGAPLVTVVVLGAFVGYSTYAAFAGRDYFYNDHGRGAPLLSPFYSPCLSSRSCTASGGLHWFAFPWSPALLILLFPLGFRLTCYYYRKAYYRSFWQSPPACAVAEPHARYTGERRFPLILQNSHRYWFYIALLFAGILTWDAVDAFHGPGGWGYLSVGTLVLVVNAICIWVYTLSCHSCRHILGGRLNHFSRHPLRYRYWMLASRLNARHMQFAWLSLVWVAVSDLYIRLLASGLLSHDPRLF
ncbi:MAG TPA: hypothetical protein VNG13_08100 [Mycobacteriales bacterium]|nr:hypothetical protein [Mycobacteriales bacterium]